MPGLVGTRLKFAQYGKISNNPTMYLWNTSATYILEGVPKLLFLIRAENAVLCKFKKTHQFREVASEVITERPRSSLKSSLKALGHH